MTWQPTDDQITGALGHAMESAPLESCGVIAGGEYVPLKNTATAHDTFVMDMRGYVAVAKAARVEAIVHSHVYRQPIASDADRAMCEKTGLPWLIVSWPLATHLVIEPCGWRAPLVGREWAWGSHDCYGLMRDGIHDYAGIEIPDYEREWLWWKNGGDIITSQFESAGFIRLPPDTKPQHCDLFGMKLNSPVVNHLGLFLEPDVILHQLMGQLSRRDVYGGLYQRATILHLRHERLMA